MPSHLASVTLRAAVALAALGLACAGARQAGSGSSAPAALKSFPVEDRGAIQVAIPSGWTERQSEATSVEAAAAPTIELAPKDRAFVVLLTPFVNPGEGATAGSDAAQVLVEMARRKALGGAEEKEIALQELRGRGDVHGYWFAATDRSMSGKKPDADEYRHLMQGAAAVGDLILAFTLLDNGDGPQREQVLELIRGARHVAEGGGAPSPRTEADRGVEAYGLERDPKAGTEPVVLGTTDGKVTALVDLPGFTMYKPRRAADGASVLVLGEQRDEGLVASLVLTRPGAHDARACRDQAVARIQRSVPEVEALRRWERKGAARVTYDVREAGTDRRLHHAHAFLARDGVCVSVHVSNLNPLAGAEEEARLERILGSLRLSEVL